MAKNKQQDTAGLGWIYAGLVP
uniref:Uncharacterized protein n=1 Tax=Anguilla anguilla TaxID=7936 RepID=A0A0E9V9D3_ANGAN